MLPVESQSLQLLKPRSYHHCYLLYITVTHDHCKTLYSGIMIIVISILPIQSHWRSVQCQSVTLLTESFAVCDQPLWIYHIGYILPLSYHIYGILYRLYMQWIAGPCTAVYYRWVWARTGGPAIAGSWRGRAGRRWRSPGSGAGRPWGSRGAAGGAPVHSSVMGARLSSFTPPTGTGMLYTM